MRDIKFRAWHETENEMISSPFQSHVFRWLEDGQPIKIMQYTGLKDKNGKEIYEGDILEHDHVLDSAAPVSFFEGAFIVGKNLTDNALIRFNCPKYTEVIGNIYENPELLEQG